MEARTAYEVLDSLAAKSKVFKIINDDFKAKDKKIAALEAENLTLKTDQVSTLEAVAELYEMILGGIL